jgi:hypothetical protein
MLPLLRVLPVGSLLLSALVFMLAATPPRERLLPHALAPAQGPLIDAAEHPEWRQFYLQAAFKRADELERMRELPNTPTRMPPVATLPEPQKPSEPSIAVVLEPQTASAPPAPQDAPPAPVPAADAAPQQIAGLPSEQATADSEDITGALDSPTTAATMPMDIGETSSTELPVIVLPERSRLPIPRPKAGSRAKTHKAKQSAAKPTGAKPQTQPAAPANSFQSLFGSSSQ